MPKKKAKNRPKIENETESTVSRRTVLKIGAAAGAATVLAPHIITREAQAYQQSVPIPLVQCLANPAGSPATTPFVDELPVPFPAIDHPLSPQPSGPPAMGSVHASSHHHGIGSQARPAPVPLRSWRVIYLGIQWSLSGPNDPESIWPINHRSVPEQFAAERR
jgi:hypothetical protein